jgi:hypothetical protein
MTLPILLKDGSLAWIENKQFHRKTLPARIWANGFLFYYTKGRLDRTVEPTGRVTELRTSQ